jgi:putative photosynthetic complex assembly protein 2
LTDYFLAVATVTLAWWLSTGVVLLLNHRTPATRRLAMWCMSAISLVALLALPTVSRRLDASGALLGFVCGLGIWAWLEMSYLMGFITGPTEQACPDEARGLRRFWLGVQTSLYHELLVVVAVVLSFLLTAGGENRVAAATCATLGLMRWSAKLNLFLGVRNYNQDWLPERLAYLDSYTRRARMNPLFPVSVVIAGDPFERAADLLVSALLSLAVLEHWFLMLPFGESALWRWARDTPAGRAAGDRLRPLSAEKSV